MIREGPPWFVFVLENMRIFVGHPCAGPLNVWHIYLHLGSLGT